MLTDKEDSYYDRYNQEGDEVTVVHCDKATFNGLIMKIAITFNVVYNLK